ncbi:MAG: squalene/phytoene synthase family protein, partial [Taibaiella sp.]|nr:squalene/phytoene synthase family protein [Taibaiella sp.]
SIAMQLSNFWRDIGEDWERSNRIYIPQEDMEQFKYTEQELTNRRIDNRFIDLLEYLFDCTEQYYIQARDGIAMLESGRWAVMSGLEIYRAILLGIRRNKYDVFTKRAGTSRYRKMGLVIKSWWQVR